MPVNTISERPSSDKTIKEVRIETQRTRGVDPSWELFETATSKMCRMRLEPSDGSIVFETNDGVGGGWVDAGSLVSGTSVDAAGAVMNTDSTTAAMSFVIDEDAMGSDSDTKVPTQQSVKAYVDANGASSPLTLTSNLAAEIPLTIVAHATQSANMQEWEDSSNVVGAHVTSSQEFHNTGGGTNSCVYGAGAGVDSDEPRCTAIGDSAVCYGDDAVAIGYNAVAGGAGSTTYQDNVVIGSGASSVLSSGVAIGKGATTNSATSGIAIGANSSVTGSSGTAVGTGASAGTFGTAVGQGASNSGSGISFGRSASGPWSVGYSATSSHSTSMSLGTSANATAIGSMAIGSAAASTHNYSLCVGREAASTAASQLVVGSDYLGLGGIKDVYIGEGVTTAGPADTTYHATGGSGTNIAAGDIVLAGGKATGNAAGGGISFETSNAGGSGTTLQTLTEKARIDVGGDLLVGVTTAPSGGGSPALVMADASSDPTGMPTNSAGFFAKDVAGTTEAFAIDEGGTATQLTAHAKDGPDSAYADPVAGPGVEWVLRREIPWTGINGDLIGRIGETLEGAVVWHNPQTGVVSAESFKEYVTRMGFDEAGAVQRGYVARNWSESQAQLAETQAAEETAWSNSWKAVRSEVSAQRKLPWWMRSLPTQFPPKDRPATHTSKPNIFEKSAF